MPRPFSRRGDLNLKDLGAGWTLQILFYMFQSVPFYVKFHFYQMPIPPLLAVN
jgi:hypothetical protein